MKVFLGTIVPAVCITIGLHYSDIFKTFERYCFKNICDVKRIMTDVGQKKD